MQDTKGSAVESLYRAVMEQNWEDKEYIPTMQELVPEAVPHIYSIDDEVAWLQTNYELLYYRPINSNRIIGFLLIFFRKIIRKFLSFLVHPITCDQSTYNAHLATTMRKMEIELTDQKSLIEDLKELIEQQKRELEGRK